MLRPHPSSTLFPYTTLFRSYFLGRADSQIKSRGYRIELGEIETALNALRYLRECAVVAIPTEGFEGTAICCAYVDRKSTRLNSSHGSISYAVFCLKKKK